MMKGTAVFKALGPVDLRNVARDEMLRWMAFIPLLIAVAVRYGWPALVAQLQTRYQFDLLPYQTMIMSYLVIGSPVVFGVVIGFLLLDERDEGSLIALQVTPLSLTNYLIYRLGLPVVLTMILVLISLPLAGIHTFSWDKLLLLAVVTAPLAPMLAIFLAAFANNKVQGFALMKGGGILFVLPFVAYFLADRWQWLFGLFPTYWAPKLYWMISEGVSGVWLVALGGLVNQLLWIYLLGRRFNRTLHQ
jgi:fluoroquinolone transport system permease protein